MYDLEHKIMDMMFKKDCDPTDRKMGYLNIILDDVCHRIKVIEIKSCVNKFVNGHNGYFTLDEVIHKNLIDNDGYYLFILKWASGRKNLKFIKAKSITWAKNISWTRILD